jgi:hypothetical protein
LFLGPLARRVALAQACCCRHTDNHTAFRAIRRRWIDGKMNAMSEARAQTAGCGHWCRVELGVRSRTLVETRSGLDRRQLAMTTAARHCHCNQPPFTIFSVIATLCRLRCSIFTTLSIVHKRSDVAKIIPTRASSPSHSRIGSSMLYM